MAHVYGGEGPNALLIPHFIKARTAQLLMRACFENNAKLKAYVPYFDIQYVEAERAWYAWYFLSLDNRNSDNAITEST